MKETYKPIILARRAKRNGITPPESPGANLSVRQVLVRNFLRPLHMLVTEVRPISTTACQSTQDTDAQQSQSYCPSHFIPPSHSESSSSSSRHFPTFSLARHTPSRPHNPASSSSASDSVCSSHASLPSLLTASCTKRRISERYRKDAQMRDLSIDYTVR